MLIVTFPKKANIYIHDHGTVLFHGDGDTPPEHLQKLVKDAIEANI